MRINRVKRCANSTVIFFQFFTVENALVVKNIGNTYSFIIKKWPYRIKSFKNNAPRYKNNNINITTE